MYYVGFLKLQAHTSKNIAIYLNIFSLFQKVLHILRDYSICEPISRIPFCTSTVVPFTFEKEILPRKGGKWQGMNQVC